MALKLYIQQNLQKLNLQMLLETLIMQVADKSMREANYPFFCRCLVLRV